MTRFIIEVEENLSDEQKKNILNEFEEVIGKENLYLYDSESEDF